MTIDFKFRVFDKIKFDLDEILYSGAFQVADYESEFKIQKFNMANPNCRPKCRKLLDLLLRTCNMQHSKILLKYVNAAHFRVFLKVLNIYWFLKIFQEMGNITPSYVLISIQVRYDYFNYNFVWKLTYIQECLIFN